VPARGRGRRGAARRSTAAPAGVTAAAAGRTAHSEAQGAGAEDVAAAQTQPGEGDGGHEEAIPPLLSQPAKRRRTARGAVPGTAGHGGVADQGGTQGRWCTRRGGRADSRGSSVVGYQMESVAVGARHFAGFPSYCVEPREFSTAVSS
jgi:hypothetical protein